MPSKPNKLFPTSAHALTAHKMAMQGDADIYEARFWRNFHQEYPDVAPGAVQSVLEHNWDELDNLPPDRAIDRLVQLAGGSRSRPPPRASSEEWPKHRNPDEPQTTADIVRRRASKRREWEAALAPQVAERRLAEAPLVAAKKELAKERQAKDAVDHGANASRWAQKLQAKETAEDAA